MAQRRRAAFEVADDVVDAGAADVLLDQARVARIVLDHDDFDGGWTHRGALAHRLSLDLAEYTAGKVTVKGEPAPNSDLTATLPPRRRARLRT